MNDRLKTENATNTPRVANPLQVETRSRLSGQEFQGHYVRLQKPVLISGMLEECAALGTWSSNFFRKAIPDLTIAVKRFTPGEQIQTEAWRLADYADYIDAYEQSAGADDRSPPAYCHDVPLLGQVPALARDLEPFPVQYLPGWYHDRWWRYFQFFLGPENSITPLHFDCLLTHNLFFQLSGTKEFTLLSADDREVCGRNGWRWFGVDPDRPDEERYPDYRTASPVKVAVGPGDILFIPAGMLHYVRSLDAGVSINIDWHTRGSAIKGMAAAFAGMPLKNVYYNALLTAGLVGGIPAKYIFPLYRSYLNYVS